MKRKAPGDGDANDTSSVVDLFGLAENRRVLLVGEGNLSFAASISKLTNKFILIASTYETEEQHCERFQGSQARTEELRKAGVQVLFGVDATDLASTLPQEVRERPFDRIIFQFPQHKERNKIHLNRELLCTFLREAKALLAPAGEVVVSLVQGQGGTPAEPGPARRPKDTWQAEEMGLEAGLLLTRVVPCPHLELEQLGYESTGFRGQGLRGSTKEVYQERSFNSNGSLTHCYAAPGDGTSAAFPTERKHDISFWISPDFTEELLLRCFSSTAGRLNGLQPELKLLDEYCSPLDGRHARTYRLSVTSSTKCITQDVWKHLCSDLRERLMQDPSVEPRRSQKKMFGPCRNYQKLILHLQDDCCHCLGIQAIDLGERSRLFKGFKGFKAP